MLKTIGMWSAAALGLTLLVWFSVHYLIESQGYFPSSTPNTKFFEFDFAGYCFGLVAVAVSCAGVYLSLVVDRASDLLMRMVEIHLMPDPFGDRKTLEEICRPQIITIPLERTDKVKVTYAISQLPRWKTLDQTERLNLTGREGLDAERLSNGRRFRWYQNQHDRIAVLLFAIVISVLYAVVPFLYGLASGQAIVAQLFTIYILCFLEIGLCTFLFWRRDQFLSNFEVRMSSWRPDLKMFMLMVVTTGADTASSSQTSQGAQSPPNPPTPSLPAIVTAPGLPVPQSSKP
jgi:hypothetical protein